MDTGAETVDRSSVPMGVTAFQLVCRNGENSERFNVREWLNQWCQRILFKRLETSSSVSQRRLDI
jgi:hypothetical protein